MKYLKFVFSSRTTLVLMLLFALAMAVATFIENDHGTNVARTEVYDSWWFELILIWLGINFLSHLGKHKLLHAKRWPVGLFHLSFVLILMGAGITRYFSNEGIIHIREGQEESIFYSTDKYLQIRQIGIPQGLKFEKPLNLVSRSFKEQSVKVDFPEHTFSVVFEEMIQGAKEEFMAGTETLIDLAVATGGGREDFLLKENEELTLGNITLGSHMDSQNPIRIYRSDTAWSIETDIPLQLMEMSTQQMGTVHAGSVQELKLRTLYQCDEGAFMIKAIHENAALKYVAEEDGTLAKELPDVLKISIRDLQGNKLLETYIHQVSLKPKPYPFQINGKQFVLTYGPKAVQLPFSLHLNAFELERYPGSQSPSSYASEVQVMDGDVEFPYRIFMNNVLDYKGYRFYQASYDTDEKGTVLSINQDRPGTLITYLGYTLLTLGMFLTLFAKGSRFGLLNNRLGKLQKNSIVLLLLLTVQPILAQNDNPGPENSIVPIEIAEEYGKLIVQDLDGRMKPLNTLAHEIVRKLAGKTKITIVRPSGTLEMSPEQFLLAVQLDPVTFSELPLIKLDQHKSLEAFEALEIAPKSHISFKEFLNEQGEYLLLDLVENANKLKPSERNEGHKELLKTDEKFNIYYALLTGDFLKIFPNKSDHNNTWFTAQQYRQGFDEEDAVFVGNISGLYLSGLEKGLAQGDWAEANEVLRYIRLYQQKAGSEVYPHGLEIKAELLYNKINLGARLFGPFLLLGISLLTIGILRLFQQAKWISISWKTGEILSWIGFLAFTFHLALRWYIAKHPPWSDGFEMLVFVAWGVLFFGLLFSKKSRLTLPLGLLFSGTLLFVGFLDWLNPEITNLMPVLNSYWLKIHVAIIVSGYAPLALAAIIALLSLLMLIFKPKVPKSRWWSSMQELKIVNEMSITIGLFLLTVGTFLGGVWANESWGRYWAWDPKETWALISVMVYAFVLHLRLVPFFKSALIYNLASLWAFSSIIMTSFGVNYYLSGLHSYAKGDPVPIPTWVYWVVLVLLVISIAAGYQYKKLNPEERKNLRGL